MVNRHKAQEQFEALPWPSKTDEEWRRTDPAGLIPLTKVPPETGTSSLEVGWEPLPASLIQQGVILTDLRTASKQFPHLLEEHLLGAGELEGLTKFVAQHEALFEQGLLCYVPEGISVEIPLKAWIQGTKTGTSLFPHTLLVVGEGSKLTLIEEHRSLENGGKPLLANTMVEIILKKEARLQYLHLQRWGSTVTEIFSQRAVLERDAQLLNVTVGLGSTLTKGNVETVLAGTGGRADLLGVFFGSDTQHFDFHTLQDHRAEHTTSDLLYKSALKDTAWAIYTGLIRIRKEAQKSDAYQANRNLLLNQGAKADSIPMLEIEADDVRCTHGVAIGPVDEEQAFYLMSRGLPKEEAQRLIVEGFFDQVFQRIPVENLQTELMGEVTKRLQ